jgi:hypothetical protein
LAFGDIDEDGVGDLQDVGYVFFDLVAPFEDFVFVAGDFEAFLVCVVGLGWVGLGVEGQVALRTLFHAHHGDVGDFDLIRRLDDSDGHVGRCGLVERVYGELSWRLVLLCMCCSQQFGGAESSRLILSHASCQTPVRMDVLRRTLFKHELAYFLPRMAPCLPLNTYIVVRMKSRNPSH